MGTLKKIDIQAVIHMLMDVDSYADRTCNKSLLQYDKNSLSFIKKTGLATFIGNTVTRRFNSFNYDLTHIKTK